MARRKQPQTSADVVAEIRRLEEQRERLIAIEDQRRGALLRECLTGRNGDAIRNVLGRVIPRRDAHLFGLDSGVAETSAR